MGTILVHKPSKFEQDHIGAVIALGKYVEKHDALPDWRWVHRMERKDEINHSRFHHYHPNIDYYLHLVKPPPPHIVDCNPHVTVPIPPVDYCHLLPSSIPEPSSVVMFSIALIVFVLVKSFSS